MILKGDALYLLNSVIQLPAFLIDGKGMILGINRKAELLVQHDNSSGKSLPADFSEFLFNDLPGRLLQLTGKAQEAAAPVSDCLRLRIPAEAGYTDYSISIIPLDREDYDPVFILTLDGSEKKGQGENRKIHLTVSTEEISSLINNQDILKIIEDIKTSYPFTFLTKTKLQNEINRLEELFWLKTTDGNYILVNNRYSQLLGLKPVQLEGKNENDFLPHYLTDLYSSVKKFIQNTSNVVIRQGLALPAPAGSVQQYQVIEFPFCDLDNNVIAILGITQPAGRNEESEKDRNDFSVDSAVLGQILYPFALLNSEGYLKTASRGFMDISGLRISQGMDFTEFLPDSLAIETEEFIRSGNKKESKSLKIALQTREDSRQAFHVEQSFVFNIRKIYNSADEIEGFLLTLDKTADEGTQNQKLSREKMYEILMQTSPEPIFIYDIENLRFLEVNQAALVLYGYSYNDFLQMDLTDLYAPEDIQTLLDQSGQPGKEGVFTGPWRHKKRDGNTILVEISKTAFDYKGKKSHFNIVRDVTEKVELHKQLQLYKAAFENMSDMLFVTDAEGFITEANSSVYEMLGYSKADLDNRPFATLVSDQERALINSGIFYSTQKNPVDIPAHLKKSDGSMLDVKLVASPVIDFNGQTIAHDIIVRTFQQPVVQYIEVEKPVTVEKIITSDNSAAAPAAAIDPSFLSTVFHEILTPMNVILGFIQEITETAGSDEAEVKEAVEIIDQNRQLLLQTMDSAIEYSQFEQNKVDLNIKKVVFTEILDSIEKNTRKIIAQNKITFSYGKISSSLSLDTDAHRLETLLSSLITIAVHQTREKQLLLSAYQYDDESCIVTLKDRRGGITNELASKLEEIFSTDDKAVIKNAGLSPISFRLTRKILNLLSGRFEAVRRAGEISECGFVFPLMLGSKAPAESLTGKLFEERAKAEPAITKPEEKAESLPLSTPLEREPASDIDWDFMEGFKKPEDIQPPAIFDLPVLEEVERAVQIKEPLKFFDEPVMKTVEEPKPPVKTLSKTDLSRLRCLYVEDQIDSQILFKVQMKDLKSIDFAVSFESALPLLEPGKFDFIVMDINLQGEYNGLDALRIIRRLPGYDKSFIIAVTAYVLPGDKEKFIAAGFNGFISKPILREKLIESLEGYFRTL